MPHSDDLCSYSAQSTLIKGTTCKLNDTHNSTTTSTSHVASWYHVHCNSHWNTAFIDCSLHTNVVLRNYWWRTRTERMNFLQAPVKQMMTSTVTATHHINSCTMHNYTNNASSSNNNNNSTLTASSSVSSSRVPTLIPMNVHTSRAWWML